jgi:hypothetical protein
VAGAGERLRSSDADKVVLSLAEAVVQSAKFSVSIAHKMIPGAIPDNEEKRLEELARLHLANGTGEEVFDRITKKLARIFEVPIALITFIDPITNGLNRKSGCRRKSPKRSRRRVSFRCAAR